MGDSAAKWSQAADTLGFVDNWQGRKSLAESNLHMLTSEDSCDVTFLMGAEGQVIKAHRYILISRSCVFHSMFTGPLAETSEVKIPDIEAADFNTFLTYLYTNKTTLRPDNVTALLYTAKKYAVIGLEDLCRHFLTESLTGESACTILKAAHHFDEDELHEKAFNEVLENAHIALKTSGFLELDREHLAKISEAKELNADEEVLFDAVNKWTESECLRKDLKISPQTKRSVLGDIVANVRFKSMALTFISKQVKESGLLPCTERLDVMDSIVCPESHNPPLRRYKPKLFSSKFRFGSSSGSHVYRGTPDAISFLCNKNIQLHGLKLYGPGNDTATYKVTSYFGTSERAVRGVFSVGFHLDSGMPPLLQEETTYTAEKETYDVLFPRPQDVTANTWYILAVTIKGPTSPAGRDGKMAVECEKGIQFSFSNADFIHNQTSCAVEQIPSLIYSLANYPQ